jgi:DNA transformation protein and related proteins
MSRSLDLMGEACAGLRMTTRKMFGGHGFFAPHGGMFAGIVDDDEIVLKLQRGGARDELMALGGHPWVYEGRDKPMTMQEWIVIPENFYDDTEQLAEWLKRAHSLAPAKVQKPQPEKQRKQTAKKATSRKR